MSTGDGKATARKETASYA